MARHDRRGRACGRLGRQAGRQADGGRVQTPAAEYLARFVTVHLGSGLRLLDCPVHVHPNGRSWVALPGRPLLDEDGRHKRDVNGKPAYVPVAEWPDRATSDRFSGLVIGQLRQRFPNALDGEAG